MIRSIWNMMMVPGRAVFANTERLKAQKTQFEMALKRLDLEQIEKGYRPKITQPDLNQADWQKPSATTSLIEAERTSIARYLEEHWVNADFPEQPRTIIRLGMEKVWTKLQGRVHQRIFGGLELPAFFDIERDPDGLVLFERTTRQKDAYGREVWVGVKSDWRYGERKPVFRNALAN